MSENEKIELYEDQPIRTAWNETEEEWYFSIVDVVGVLTEQKDQRGASNYWATLKQRLKAEGADQLLTNCQQLKLKASDGRHRLTDVATTEQLLRIIQSIPSKKAEPFKMWLAQIGRERIEETIDPEYAGRINFYGNFTSGTDKAVWNKHRVAAGMIMPVICCAVFILTGQPYAGIICFSVLIVKVF